MSIFSGLAQGLLPASFRGVPFVAQASGIAGGRRIALHLYPGRDEPWAEDMGRAPRRFRLRGFLLADDKVYLGGPVALQRLLLLAALEKSGSGTLTHPTVGVVNVAVAQFSISEELDAARRSSVEIEFVESGKRSFPSILSSSSGLLTAANLCKVALVLDGVRLIAAAISAGGRREDVAGSAALWSAQTSALGADATALTRLAAQLPGDYGRYAAGGNAGLSGPRASAYTAATTVSDLVVIASSARSAITNGAEALTGAIEGADLTAATGVADDVTVLVQSLADACADPTDAMRLLEQLIAFDPAPAVAASLAGVAIAGMFRRAAAAALVTAAGDYQPKSADDAAATMGRLARLLDDLATEAADAGDDESFKAIRAGRAAMVKDLRQRGAGLAAIATFAFGRPLPAVTLAQRLYLDPTRADQLLGQIDACVHPLFMPTSFQALAA